MRKFRFGLIVFAFIIIIGQVTVTDYGDLNLSNKAGSYLVIITMVCVIIAMISSNHYKKRIVNDFYINFKTGCIIYEEKKYEYKKESCK